jgi:hydrogenase maturation protein HypF
MVEKLLRQRSDFDPPFSAVALSGGVFQNRVLLEQVCQRLAPLPLRVLTQHQFPANDGGLSLGQAAVAAARSLAPPCTPKETTPCASAFPD